MMASELWSHGILRFRMLDLKELWSQTLGLEPHSSALNTNIQLSLSPHLSVLCWVLPGSQQSSFTRVQKNMATEINILDPLPMAGNRGPCPGRRTVHRRGHLGVLRHTEEALGIWRPEKPQENLGPQLRLLLVHKTKQLTSTQVQAQAPRLVVLEMWINLHSSAFCEGLLYWPGGQSTFLSLVTHLIWHYPCQTTQPF